jgi:hypothetical protein
MTIQKHAEDIVAGIIKQIRSEMGGGWDHFSPQIRKDMVKARAFALTVTHPESIEPARIVAMARAMADAIHKHMDS